MGVKKTTDVVEKSTWMLSLALLVFTLMINLWIDRGGESQESTQLRDKAESVSVDVPAPGAPAPASAGAQAPTATGGSAPDAQGQGSTPASPAP